MMYIYIDNEFEFVFLIKAKKVGLKALSLIFNILCSTAGGAFRYIVVLQTKKIKNQEEMGANR